MPARQRLRGGLGQLFKGLRRSNKNRDFLLPDGSSSEQCGERRTDLLLVWSTRPGEPDRPDADSIGLAAGEPIPEAEPEPLSGFRSGNSSARRRRAGGASSRQQATGSPREQAERLVAAARRAGDRAAEATALDRPGSDPDQRRQPAGAVASLRIGACDCSRARRPRAGERHHRQPGPGAAGRRASPRRRGRCLSTGWGTPDPNAITWARKPPWSAWGLLTGICVSSPIALSCFEQALSLARLVGDRMQAANLLWYQGIQYAELGQRDLAIAKAEESIALFKAMGRPQAAWYGSHLQKYRMGLYEEAPAAAGAGVSLSPQSYLGGAIVASVMPGQPGQGQAASQPNSGPGLLAHGDVGNQGDGDVRRIRHEDDARPISSRSACKPVRPASTTPACAARSAAASPM